MRYFGPAWRQLSLDGRPVGTIPTQITASRRNREPVIGIEKAGFQSAAYRIERREDWSTVLWDVALGVAIIATTGRLLLKHDEANPTFGQLIARSPRSGRHQSCRSALMGCVFR